ncbi:hypothetical protein TWF696_007576 [Orbilia brochopaga]|uniref:Uncharacterized protein n=1 Tax=Orbilia brochopaga TaxID=3140254 RepID=A0AAV9UQ16_9PEZI
MTSNGGSRTMPYSMQEDLRNRFVGKRLIIDPNITVAGTGEVLRSDLPQNHRLVRIGSRALDEVDGWRMTVLIDDSDMIRRLDFY